MEKTIAVDGRLWVFEIRPRPLPIETIIDEIERALRHELWYAALATALSLPDVCSVLAHPPNKAGPTGKRYAAWFDEWMARYSTSMTGLECYRIRCGVFHRGEFSHKHQRWDRIIFTLPANVRVERSEIQFTGGYNYVLQLDLEWFCYAMIDAARRWYAENRSNANVVENGAKAVRYRHRGIPRVFEGPLIA
jgi:hypothetical protein